jgi:hypothetical protein
VTPVPLWPRDTPQRLKRASQIQGRREEKWMRRSGGRKGRAERKKERVKENKRVSEKEQQSVGEGGCE